MSFKSAFINAFVVFSEDGYIIFDDTVLEKRNTKKIEIRVVRK